MSTKRILALILTLVMCFSLAAPAYAVGESYTVTFVYGDGNIVEQTVVADQEDALGSFGMLNKPADPTREDANGIHYVFDRWESSEGGDFFNGEDAVAIRSDETVTARWEEHLAEGSEIVAQNENGDIEYLSDTTKTITEIVGSKNIVRVQDVALKASNVQGDNSVAEVGGIYYDTLQEAINAAEDGGTVTLVKDADITNEKYGTRNININKSLTLNGDGHTITASNRGIAIGDQASANVNVTIQNVTINNASSGARCIDTRGNIGTLTLDHVTLSTQGAAGGYTQPLTIGGNQSTTATINITNSTIQTNTDATAYYAIITFNPVNMTISNSTVKGWACIYAKGKDGSAGSAGSVFNIVNNSVLESSNKYNGASNAFAMFMAEDKNVTFDVNDSTLKVHANSDQEQAVVSKNSTGLTGVNFIANNSRIELDLDNAVLAFNQANYNVDESNVVIAYRSDATVNTGAENEPATVTLNDEGDFADASVKASTFFDTTKAGVKPVKIESSVASITFDADAIQAIDDNVKSTGTDSIHISMQDVSEVGASTKTISITLVDENNNPIFDAENAGGKALVKVPFEVADGNLPVVNLVVDGVKTPVKVVSYDATSVTFEAEHFSDYEVGQTAPVASVNGTEYATLAEAIAAANTSTAESVTITVLADCEIPSTYTHYNPLVLTKAGAVLDLGGKTVTLNENMAFFIQANNAIVKNGSFAHGATSTETGMTDYCRYGLVVNACDGVTITGITSDNGIAIGADPVTYSGTTQPYNPNAGAATNVTISDCNITGWGISNNARFAIFAQNGSDVTITSGTYSAHSSGESGVLYATSATDGGEGVIRVTGGKFTGTINDGGKPSNVVITGGHFTVDPTAYLPAGYERVTSTENGYTWTVQEKAVASVNGVNYNTLAKAFAAANASTDASVTITLLADCDTGAADINNPLVLSKANATFDLNNKTVTVNNNFSLVMQGNGITVSNGKIYSGPNSAKKTNYNSYVLVVNNCENVNLTGLEMLGGVSIGGSQSDWGEKAGAAKNVTITACQITSGDYYAVCSQMGSDATIVSGTYISNQNAVNNKGNLSPAVIYGRFVGNDGPEGYITVTGGSFSGKIGDANKDWIVLKGGIYTVKPSDSLADADYEVVSNTDSATMGTYPWTVKSHEHSYGVPTWTWGRINGAWAAAATFACTKSDDTQNVRAEISEDTAQGYKTITATVTFEGKTYADTRNENVSYVVKLNGSVVNSYKWGEICLLTSPDGQPKQWLDANNTVLADGRAKYNFPVTSDIDIITVAATADETAAVISATLTTSESGKAVYNVKWSLPENSQNVKVMVHRGAKSNDVFADRELLENKGIHYDTGLNVRNGDYKLTISNLTPTKYQNVITVITYTINGEQKELVAPVMHIRADGQSTSSSDTNS